ncbi:MAG: ribose ABC transporter substrate-binding protein RbsB [Candidatus Promineifilaceae bacterium]
MLLARSRLFTLLATVALLALFACAPEEVAPEVASTPEPTQPIVIGVSLSNLDNPFFVALQEGVLETAERLGATVVIEDAQDDVQQQITQIETLIAQQVDALLINPVNSMEIEQALQEAFDAGIPIFTVDRSANSEHVVAHIASDNVSGGRMAAAYLAEIINESGNVVELAGIPDTSAAQDRGLGFNNVITIYPDIRIIARETANFNREQGHDVFAQLLADNADIDGVFAHNDEMILGAIAAAREAGRLDEIAFVGFDAIEDAVVAIENGELHATVAQQPKEMGRLSVETILQYLDGESVSSFIPVDLALITR